MAAADKQIVLITGANQGLGYETAKNLLASSTYHVIIGSRTLAKGEAAVKVLQDEASNHKTVSVIEIDVTDDASIQAAARNVAAEFGRLDILVNNAGIISLASQPDPKQYRDVLNTNAVGPMATTEAFLPLLRLARNPRLVFVSSSVGSISQAADPLSPYYSTTALEYRSSKACLNMLIVLYHNRLKSEGFKVLGADPGLCATNFTGNPQSLRDRGAVSPTEGAARIATVIKGEQDTHLGRVVGVYGVSPW